MLDRKIGATRCQIFRLKCIKFDFRWGSAPDTAWEAYSTPPDSLAGGLLLRRGRGSGREGEEKKGREGGKGMERENDIKHPLSQIPGYATGRDPSTPS